MTRIFLSYRRADTGTSAGRMAQFLDEIPEIKEVFLDVDAISVGDDFEVKIKETLDQASHCFVLIGEQWAGDKTGQKRSRLFDPQDYVRLEVRNALASDTRLIPILLDNAPMPKTAELPKDLNRLAKINAFMLRTAKFDEDMDDLLDDIFGVKQGRGSRWKSGRLTPGGILLRILGGVSAAAAFVFFIAVVNYLIEPNCGITCRVQNIFGIPGDESEALGSALSIIALVLGAGAIAPFLTRIRSRRR